ncbi:MAG: hypothetical protein IPI55_14060 [Flavobacteriales bacterium]|nr:hypothetical protein [Flavobacteriales bacterium]
MRTHVTLILILVSGMLVHAQGPDDPVLTASSEQARNRLFGDLSMGISNYGMAGDLRMYYRTGRTFFSAVFYRSHVCFAGDYNGVPFWRSGAAEHHVGIRSYSAGFGYMLPTRWKHGISAGLSISMITEETTDPLHNDLSMDGVHRELSGGEYEVHSHGSHSKVVPGIPIEYKVFLFDRRTIGLDMAFRIDLNTTRIFSAITLGMRIGKCR